MALTLADVRRIAHLARIEITAEQAQATLAQLNDIFAMIAQMQKVDTTGVEPMSHPSGWACSGCALTRSSPRTRVAPP